jgi:rod shape-determining protein MreD
MRRVFFYLLVGFVFVLLQTALFPRFLPFYLKPDLLLILVIYLGLNEGFVKGGSLSYILGCLQDAFAGHYLGLYGMALLALFVIVRGTAERLNTESSVLLLALVFCGTFVQGGILFFSLGFFADAGPMLPLVLKYIIPQSLINLGAAILLLLIAFRIQRALPPQMLIPGLRRLNNHYGS